MDRGPAMGRRVGKKGEYHYNLEHTQTNLGKAKTLDESYSNAFGRDFQVAQFTRRTIPLYLQNKFANQGIPLRDEQLEMDEFLDYHLCVREIYTLEKNHIKFGDVLERIFQQVNTRYEIFSSTFCIC